MSKSPSPALKNRASPLSAASVVKARVSRPVSAKSAFQALSNSNSSSERESIHSILRQENDDQLYDDDDDIEEIESLLNEEDPVDESVSDVVYAYPSVICCGLFVLTFHLGLTLRSSFPKIL